MATNNEISYFNYDEVIDVYQRMVKASGGGFDGIRDEGGIHAILSFVQNDTYCPTFSDKLTYIVFRFCSGHYFNDGNKRIALTLGAYFLHRNNYNWLALIFMRHFEAIIYHVAASNIDQDLLGRIMACFMNGEDYNEELKIDIARAMNNGSLEIGGGN